MNKIIKAMLLKFLQALHYLWLSDDVEYDGEQNQTEYISVMNDGMREYELKFTIKKREI